MCRRPATPRAARRPSPAARAAASVVVGPPGVDHGLVERRLVGGAHGDQPGNRRPGRSGNHVGAPPARRSHGAAPGLRPGRRTTVATGPSATWSATASRSAFRARGPAGGRHAHLPAAGRPAGPVALVSDGHTPRRPAARDGVEQQPLRSAAACSGRRAARGGSPPRPRRPPSRRTNAFAIIPSGTTPPCRRRRRGTVQPSRRSWTRRRGRAARGGDLHHGGPRAVAASISVGQPRFPPAVAGSAARPAGSPASADVSTRTSWTSRPSQVTSGRRPFRQHRPRRPARRAPSAAPRGRGRRAATGAGYADRRSRRRPGTRSRRCRRHPRPRAPAGRSPGAAPRRRCAGGARHVPATRPRSRRRRPTMRSMPRPAPRRRPVDGAASSSTGITTRLARGLHGGGSARRGPADRRRARTTPASASTTAQDHRDGRARRIRPNAAPTPGRPLRTLTA